LSEQVASALKHDGTKKVDAMVAAWARGDTATLSRMSADAFDKDPTLKKGILDNRNKRWVGELKAMLAEPRVYFVTVGAAHLAGPGGVPALMRAAGYRVEGPIDVTTADAKPVPALRLSRDAESSSSPSLRPAQPAKPSPPLRATQEASVSPSLRPAQTAKPSPPPLHATQEASVSPSPRVSPEGEPPSSPRLVLGTKKPSSLRLTRDTKPSSSLH
jgi:hypothetical protein